MNVFDVREAEFSVNRDDHPTSVKYRILAAAFSIMPIDQRFRRNIGKRFASAVYREEYPLISDNFPIDFYGTEECNDVSFLLSAYCGYGSEIGLTNWSPDFHYKTSQKTHDVALESERLGLFSLEDVAHLGNLGRRLLQDEKLIIPLQSFHDFQIL